MGGAWPARPVSDLHSRPGGIRSTRRPMLCRRVPHYTHKVRHATLRWCLLALAALALILVPFFVYEERILGAVDGFLRSGSSRPLVAFAILSLLASDVFAPVPSSLVATASGMLLGLVPGAIVTWLGMQAGALAGYVFGRTAGVSAARRIVGDSELARATRSHRGWGAMSLIASRAVPVLAESSVVLAGAVRMPLGRFSWLTGLSNAAIAAVYAAVGAYALETSSFLLAFAASTLVPGSLMWANRARGSSSCSRRCLEDGLRPDRMDLE